ncbi:MAG TPA: aldehyde dehydrogenase family protein [Candidatus Kapabacteria bacterium]|nr:aldehyde dehydrogenase family protein [Candidatus Kapabacteria bacterium]
MIVRNPYINGTTISGEAGTHDVINPFSGAVIGSVGYCSNEQIDSAIASAASAFQAKELTTATRSEILSNAAKLLSDLSEECARLITAESGKPIAYSRIEVSRGIFTLEASAKAAIASENVFDVDAMGASNAAGKDISFRYFPAGPVAAITPFNFPLNLALHKVAPAIGCGCPVLLKPPPQTPLTAFFLCDILAQSGLPAGWLNVVPCENDVAQAMIQDERIKTVSFTGSAVVGWKLKELVPKKKVTLELGGNAAIIVDEVKDWDKLIKSMCVAGFYYAGQVCISLQRLLVANHLYDELLERLLATVAEIKVGDPLNDDVLVGPMISEKEAKRAWGWVAEAQGLGATRHTGEYRAPNWITPVVMTNVPIESNLYKEEAFSPVVLAESYDYFEEALRKVNSSRYGLQTGVYTSDAEKIQLAYNTLEVGGVIVNDTTTFRVDTMPYGGVKDSGFGREGVEWAMREMSEVRVLVV